MSFDWVRLCFKAVAGDDVIPVGYMASDSSDKGIHTGVTCLAFFREDGAWKCKNVSSIGAGPTKDDMMPACQAVFPDVGITGVVNVQGDCSILAGHWKFNAQSSAFGEASFSYLLAGGSGMNFTGTGIADNGDGNGITLQGTMAAGGTITWTEFNNGQNSGTFTATLSADKTSMEGTGTLAANGAAVTFQGRKA